MNPIFVIGDVHGHLQLALCMAARWQREENIAFDAVFLCGDVGTFTSDNQLDSTTRRHGKANPCELEFLNQWAARPQPRWLDRLFQPVEAGGLGLTCPVVMVHGNHEGFEHLEQLVPAGYPDEIVRIDDLPAVEAGGNIRLLPTGWRCRTASGITVSGIGGIEQGQRYAEYHPMAYIDDDAVIRLLEMPAVDLLITHQGPSGVQGEKGSETLQMLLDAGKAKVWCHGHSVVDEAIVRAGTGESTRVVPLDDIAFPGKGLNADDPGEDGFCLIHFEPAIQIRRVYPEFWRDYRKRKWKNAGEFGLVCPDLLDKQ